LFLEKRYFMKQVITLLALICFWGLALGQDKNDYSVSLDYVALSVSNLDQLAAFYESVLNLQEITNRTEKDGIRWFS
jgi:lactoylglutathione lyase